MSAEYLVGLVSPTGKVYYIDEFEEQTLSYEDSVKFNTIEEAQEHLLVPFWNFFTSRGFKVSVFTVHQCRFGD